MADRRSGPAPEEESRGEGQKAAGEEDLAEGEEPDRAEPEEEQERQARAPWHFKVVVVGSVVYLGYRAYQGISWLAHHI